MNPSGHQFRSFIQDNQQFTTISRRKTRWPSFIAPPTEQEAPRWANTLPIDQSRRIWLFVSTSVLLSECICLYVCLFLSTSMSLPSILCLSVSLSVGLFLSLYLSVSLCVCSRNVIVH